MEAPPLEAEVAFLAPTSELISRIEIYHSDGVTRWENGVNDDRLLSGSVTVDYARDERRAFDLELDNSDFILEHAPGKFWYDKILKIYSGVRYIDTTPVISQLITTNYSTNPRVGTDTTTWGAISGTGGVGAPSRITGSGCPQSDTAYQVNWTTATTAVSGGWWHQTPAGTGITAGKIYSISLWAWSSKSQRVSFAAVFTNDAGAAQGSAFAGPIQVLAANTWTEIKIENMLAPANSTRLYIETQAAAGAGASNWAINDKYVGTAVTIVEGTTARSFFSGATADFANRDYAWTSTADASTSTETITVSTPSAIQSIWEVQVGEFMIDKIAESHFPYTVRVNGRDYTKKCLNSKFTTATAFADGTAIETAIGAMAASAGCTKMLLPPTGHALGKDYFFERGVSRWEAMLEIASAFGYELFFDAQGYLLMRENLDPVTAPLSYTLATGPSVGNLVTYEKNLNDTRIYNHIIVTGESADSEVLPVSAEATNTEPSSPTRVSEIGDRVYQYTSAFITTTLQAQDVADKFLKIHALEEFDLNFESINFPWLEVGEIVEFVDPRPSAGQPTRFLLSSISLNLGLGAMSGNAKRVTVVG